MKPTDSIRRMLWFLCLTALTAVVLCGCRQQLQTEYGRARGSGYADSLNGTVVLQEMVRAAGHRVHSYGRFSPRWENYQTVYWFPDGLAAPGPEAVTRMEAWLAAAPNRTLVFVARDFDAAISYWDGLRKNSSNGQTEQLQREYADAIAGYLSRRGDVNADEGDWYQRIDHPYQPAASVEGSLTDGIDSQRLDLRYGSLPVPGDISSSGTFKDYDAQVLLAVDDIPMVYTLQKPDWRNSRIMVVGNGSFLLNLPLANEENRLLASQLITKVHELDGRDSDVLFIESTDDIAISDQDARQTHSRWSWITSEPLRYIVPNILFWCLLFCFVYFPIFGRPRNIKSRSAANFRHHVKALAQRLRKTGSRTEAESWIAEYRRHSNSSRTISSGPDSSGR